MKTYAARRRLPVSEGNTSCSVDVAIDRVPRLVLRKRRSESPDPPKRPKKSAKHVQSTLDFGSSLYTKCKVCGMTYSPIQKEDKQLHARFHLESTHGLLLSRKMMGLMYSKALRPLGNISKSHGRLHESNAECADDISSDGRARQMYVVCVDRKSSQYMKTIARRVLTVAEAELGALRTGDDELWGQVSLSCSNEKQRRGSNKDVTYSQKCDRYLLYLVVLAQSCVGLCLVEHIFKGQPVLNTSDGDNPTALRVGSTYRKAKFGISRIWVSQSSRRRKIGYTLLDTVIHDADPRCTTTKEEIAFSQPTNLGSKLACRWFGRGSGWLLYDENCRIEHCSDASSRSMLDT